MVVLIVGAQLANKGAESMLYISVDEIRKRFPDAEILFATEEIYNDDKYTFKKLNYSERGKIIALGGVKGFIELPKSICKDIIKFILGRRTHLGHYFDVKNKIKDVDIIIDVSGFAVGDKWSRKVHVSYINNIKLAQKYGIPIYLMPQSFGSFEYADDMADIKKSLSEFLKYPELIYAREKDGYNKLISEFNLNNVVISTDLVLQNSGIKWENVFKDKPIVDVCKIEGNKIVGIVPNKQCFHHGNAEKNMEIYHSIVCKLLNDGFKVILFRHSREDLEICKNIKSSFMDTDNVVLEEKEFSCLEYDEYIKQFSFIICSRFHGLVHAYRNHIPCIALGWAVKYMELTECVGQERYFLDITSPTCTSESATNILDNMEAKYYDEALVISEKVKEIQNNNCFDAVLNKWCKT